MKKMPTDHIFTVKLSEEFTRLIQTVGTYLDKRIDNLELEADNITGVEFRITSGRLEELKDLRRLIHQNLDDNE